MKEFPREICERIALVQILISVPLPNTNEIKIQLEWVLEAVKAYEQKPKNIA